MMDDDAAWCEQVCRFLEPHGYQVIVATTETAAFERLNGDIPSAIFVEPSTADHEFCRAVRQSARLQHVPMFVVSESPADVVYTKGNGVSGYVRKGVLLDHVMLLLSNS
jgi:DNA-binding response OmpR family regulator